MTWAVAVACVFVAVVLVCSARLLRRDLDAALPDGPRAWRIVVLLVAQAASAALLYATLFPPPVQREAGVLVVLTAAADRADRAARTHGAHVVAMPEAPALPGAERMPDLATALRRYPGTTALRVVGDGLTARDRDAVDGLALAFTPAPPPRGLLALWPPAHAQAGRPFEVGGRTGGLAGGKVELLDPGHAVVARAAVDAQGRFRVAGLAGTAGLSSWRLRLRAKDDTVVEEVALPLATDPGAPLRVLMLAGAPSPELKYLRRWASDAGLQAQARIDLGAGMQIGDAQAALDAESLGKLDLVVLDQRAWRALGSSRRAALDDAVRDGLGLLLRLSAPLTPADRAALGRLGFTATTARAGDAALADPPGVTVTTDRDRRGVPPLARAPLRIAAADGSPLLRDADGRPLAVWRAHGAGRIGVATFDGSFRLVLAGHGDRHGALWSAVASTLARAGASPAPTLAGDARARQRVVLCGLREPARVVAPDGTATALVVDPAAGDACAAFWPRQSGWHVLRTPATAPDDGGRRLPFHVRAASDAPGLQRMALHDATMQLAATGAAGVAASTRPVPGPRWPWFLAWLLLASALWWFERARLGVRAPPATPAA